MTAPAAEAETVLTDRPSEHQVVRRASAGARLLTARGVGMRVVSIVSNLALLALVTPADLGLLAVVRGVTALAGNTTDLGFAWALLRRQEAPSEEEYAALAGVQLLIVGALLLVAGAEPGWVARVAAVDPAWRWWMLAVLATTLTVPFGTSAKIRIERALDYRKIAFYDMSSVLLLNLALLGFAAAGHFAVGVFLATGGVILYSNLLLWWWAPGPRPGFRMSAWRRLAGQFAGFSAGHVCYLLFSSATPLVVAHLFGLSVAGMWSFAMRLGNILQVAFEGFRRAAVPAAALIRDSAAHLRQLVEDSLRGAARFTVPAIAAMYAALPVVPLVWPRWASAVGVGQLYALGFGLGGLASASLVPAAVARRGASVVVLEQVVPMAVGWLGLVLLRLLGRVDIGWVVLPMYLAQVIALWRATDREVRPRWHAELGTLLQALAAVVLGTALGQALGAPPIPVAIAAGVLFLLLGGCGPILARWRARVIVPPEAAE